MASFCMNCGAKIDPLAKFCGQCGNPADGSAPKAPVVAPKSRVRLASERRGHSDANDGEDDTGDYDGPTEVPKIDKLEIEINVGGKMEGETYSSKRFKSIKDLIENK